jgi:DNA polymerase-4
MDAFYASVELLRYPQLKGLPVVIGGGRRREDDLLGRLQAAYPDGDWTAENFAERLPFIPLEFFPRLNGYTGRGVITTATYPARQFGIGSAMGLPFGRPWTQAFWKHALAANPNRVAIASP